MPNRDIIVIGGSAGSHDVLRRTLSELPPDLPASVLIVTHIPAQQRSLLPEVLANICRLPVIGAEDQARLERGRIYVAPPDHHLLLVDSTLRLGRGPRENMARPAIDPLFRSVALAAGHRSIGVILTGMLNDGAAGLRSLKGCGGVAVVQDPEDAAADEMPRSAMAVVEPDHVCSASGLSSLLTRLAGEAAGVPNGCADSALLRLEVEIALGSRCDPDVVERIAKPSVLTCPSCQGVLSELKGAHPMRYRCQVGHAYTAEALERVQEEQVDEALRVALRMVEERGRLVDRMTRDARDGGRSSVAAMYGGRAAEYHGYADVIRKAMILRLPPLDPPDQAEG